MTSRSVFQGPRSVRNDRVPDYYICMRCGARGEHSKTNCPMTGVGYTCTQASAVCTCWQCVAPSVNLPCLSPETIVWTKREGRGGGCCGCWESRANGGATIFARLLACLSVSTDSLGRTHSWLYAELIPKHRSTKHGPMFIHPSRPHSYLFILLCHVLLAAMVQNSFLACERRPLTRPP
jgi:hypothetical protein